MLLPFYCAESQDQDPEVVYIGEDREPDPSVKEIVEESQKEAYTGRRIMGIILPVAHRPTVVPYSWR